jgi:hypothetical protein
MDYPIGQAVAPGLFLAQVKEFYGRIPDPFSWREE